MVHLKKILVPITLMLFFFYSHAQQNNSLYFLKDASQWSLLNPAFTGKQDFVIGFPVLSGLSGSFTNDFRLDDAIVKRHGIMSDTLTFDFNSFSQSIGDRNKFSFGASVLMFYGGIKSKKNFYSLSVSEKGFFNGTFDKSFIDYFKNGTLPYYGKNVELGGLSFNIGQYREVGLGFARQEDKKIGYGLRLKFLLGKINLQSERVDFRTSTGPIGDFFVNPSGAVKIAGPLSYITDTIHGSVKVKRDLQPNDYFFNLSNTGLGFDAGMTYKYNQQLSFSASLITYGIIRYSKKHFTMVAEKPLRYEKDSLTQATNPLQPQYFSANSTLYAFRDSVPFMVNSIVDNKAQWVRLPIEIYLGADYKLNPKTSVGFVQKIYLSEGFSTAATTLGIVSKVTNGLTLAGTYTATPRSFLNLGIGVVYEVSAFQFVFSSDNIYSLVFPNRVKNLNLHFGINLLVDKN
jgi:hypothetical protein